MSTQVMIALANVYRLMASPSVKLRIGLPSVQQEIEIPRDVATYYFHYFKLYIEKGVLGNAATMEIDMKLYSPTVVATLVAIIIRGRDCNWPDGITFPSVLSTDDLSHDSPMDETPTDVIGMICEVCRVGDLLLVQTDLLDVVATKTMEGILAANNNNRGILKAEHVEKIWRASAKLDGLKDLLARWVARDYLVHCRESERLLLGGSGTKETTFDHEDLLVEYPQFLHSMERYSKELVLNAQWQGPQRRVAKDLVTGKQFRLP